MQHELPEVFVAPHLVRARLFDFPSNPLPSIPPFLPSSSPSIDYTPTIPLQLSFDQDPLGDFYFYSLLLLPPATPHPPPQLFSDQDLLGDFDFYSLLLLSLLPQQLSFDQDLPRDTYFYSSSRTISIRREID